MKALEHTGWILVAAVIGMIAADIRFAQHCREQGWVEISTGFMRAAKYECYAVEAGGEDQ